MQAALRASLAAVGSVWDFHHLDPAGLPFEHLDSGLGEAEFLGQIGDEGLVGFAIYGGSLQAHAQHPARLRIVFPADELVGPGVGSDLETELHGEVDSETSMRAMFKMLGSISIPALLWLQLVPC